MATTVEDILGAGMGPVRQTFMDTQPQPTAVPAQPAGGAPSTPAAEATPTPTPATAATVTGEATGVAEPAKTLSPPETDSQHPGPQVSTDRSDEATGVENVAVTDMEQTPSVSARQQTPPRMSYVELYQRLNPYHPPTEEDLEKERKKQKRESIFAAIGDGISALSNLFFTTQYAPNAYDPSKGMTAVTRARWDKLKKEREANHREYMEGFMRAMQMDDATARDDRNWQHTIDREDRNWKHTLERERIADDRADKKESREERKAEQNELMFQARYALQLGKLTEQGYRNTIAEIKAGSIQELTDAQINRLNRTGTGGGNGHSGGTNKKGPKLQLEDDEPMQFDNNADYDRTVMRLAPEYGVQTSTVEVTARNSLGDPIKQRTVRRPVKDIAADIEREAAKRVNSAKTLKGEPRNFGNNSGSTPKKKTNVNWK